MYEMKNIINSYNFARSSDFVFAETVSHEQFKKLNISDKYIVEKNNLLITYKLDYVNLRENDVIFCNSDFLKDLFILLQKIQNLNNLKLITHQTDLAITKSLFLKKPACIAEWYSINVAYEHEKLIPIPLGIANEYSPKNLQINDLKFQPMKNKEQKLYINFNKNTNYKKRGLIYTAYENFQWSVVKNSDLNNSQYNLDLQNFLFVLCPWGNGIDTHRFWETLYSGSIPVTLYSPTYKSASNLPVIFVDDLKSITYEILLNYSESIKNIELAWHKLDLEYWISKINQSKDISDNCESLSINYMMNNYLYLKYKTSKNIKSKIKKMRYFLLKPFRFIKKISLSLWFNNY